MVNVNQMERRLKVVDVGEDGAVVTVAGSPKLEYDDSGENPTGKLMVPVQMNGRHYTLRLGTESVDLVAKALGEETADWIHGEISLGIKTERFGRENVSWVIAQSAQTTKRRDDRLEGLKSDERNSRL